MQIPGVCQKRPLNAVRRNAFPTTKKKKKEEEGRQKLVWLGWAGLVCTFHQPTAGTVLCSFMQGK